MRAYYKRYVIQIEYIHTLCIPYYMRKCMGGYYIINKLHVIYIYIYIYICIVMVIVILLESFQPIQELR